MTSDVKIAGGAITLLLLLFAAKKKRSPTAIVDFEPPTTSGPGAGRYAGTGEDAGYGVTPAETEIQRLIRLSNEAGGETVERGGQIGLAAPDYFNE